MDGLLDFAIEKQAGGIDRATVETSGVIGMADQDPKTGGESLSEFGHGLTAGSDKPLAEEEIAGGVAGDDQFRGDEKVRSQSGGFDGGLFDESGVAGQVSHGWVQLSKCDFHRVRRHPEGERGG